MRQLFQAMEIICNCDAPMYTFTIHYSTVNLRWMNFMVCKLYFNKAILRKLSKKQENLYKLGTEEELLEHTSTTNKREKKSSMGLCNKVTTEKEVQEVFATDLVMNFYA